jgi:hypothetical protein
MFGSFRIRRSNGSNGTREVKKEERGSQDKKDIIHFTYALKVSQGNFDAFFHFLFKFFALLLTTGFFFQFEGCQLRFPPESHEPAAKSQPFNETR